MSEIALSILMTSFYIRNNNNLFLAGIFFHWMMNVTAVLFQTDVTFSTAQNAPQMNIRYFVIYTILLCVTSFFVVIKRKCIHRIQDKSICFSNIIPVCFW